MSNIIYRIPWMISADYSKHKEVVKIVRCRFQLSYDNNFHIITYLRVWHISNVDNQWEHWLKYKEEYDYG